MKAIVCIDCHDVIGLSPYEERKCFCGKSGGEYLSDGHYAHVFGPCFVLGIPTPDLMVASFVARLSMKKGSDDGGTMAREDAAKAAAMYQIKYEDGEVAVKSWAMIPDGKRIIRVPAPVRKIPRVRQRKCY